MTRHAPHWEVYGASVASDRPFENRLSRTARAADLRVTTIGAAASDRAAQLTAAQLTSPQLTSRYRSPTTIDGGQPFLQVLDAPGYTLFRFTEVVDFHLSGDDVAVHVLDHAYEAMVELHLLGFVVPYWLEQRGHPALHASGVSIDGVTAAFLGRHGAGKTSLAATLLTLGHALASDDLVAVDVADLRARPGYPQMRMLPAQARHFAGRDDFERAHPGNQKLRVPIGGDGFGRFDPTPRPLAAIYLPERRPGADLRFDAVPPKDALFTLVRHSVLVGVVEAMGLAASRLHALATLLRAVPVRRVTYPEGLDRLPEVAAGIAEDVRALSASGRDATARRHPERLAADAT